MRETRLSTLAVLSVCFCSAGLAAQETSPNPQGSSRVATALRGGNLGMGLDVLYRLAPEVAGRAGLTMKGLTTSDAGTKVYWVADLLVDWQPQSWKGFRLTGGLAYLDTEPSTTKTSPMGRAGGYAGIGWGNPFSQGSRWRFLVDAGSFYRLGSVSEMQYEGPASITGKTAPAGSGDVIFVEKSRFVPTFSVGASYRF